MKMGWKSAVLGSVFLAAALPLLAQSGNSAAGQPRQGMRRDPGGRGGGVSGAVKSISGANVVVTDDQGTEWTVITTENTRLMRDRQPIALNAIQPGDEVISMGMPDADKHALHAMILMDIPAAEVAKAKENLGKTYIVGRITAIDETKLTILRGDKQTQTIQLDETSSLHRGGRIDPEAMSAAGMDGMMGGGMGMGSGRRRSGNGNAASPNPQGESITLADVKVGDSIIGVGAVKAGVFVPTDLRVQSRPNGPRGAQNGEVPPPQQ